MIKRQVIVPADADRLWRALTDPEEAGAWLGGRIEWTVGEGATLSFRPAGVGASEAGTAGATDASGVSAPAAPASSEAGAPVASDGAGAGAAVTSAASDGGAAVTPAAADGDGGPVWHGRVESVVPGRYLRFRWWPVHAGPAAASEVAYVLEPVRTDGGEDEPATVLTVEEAPVGTLTNAAAGDGAGAILAHAGADRWSPLDGLQLQLWASRQTAPLVR